MMIFINNILFEIFGTSLSDVLFSSQASLWSCSFTLLQNIPGPSEEQTFVHRVFESTTGKMILKTHLNLTSYTNMLLLVVYLIMNVLLCQDEWFKSHLLTAHHFDRKRKRSFWMLSVPCRKWSFNYKVIQTRFTTFCWYIDVCKTCLLIWLVT